MYVNNISEKSSTRLHAPPGGRQTHNIFGGGDEPQQQQQPRARQTNNIFGTDNNQQQQQAPIQQQQQQQPNQQQQPQQVAAGGSSRSIRGDNNIFGTDQPNQQQQHAPRSVNNIWGSEDNTQKSSTRVINRPGGQSSMGSILFGQQGEADEEKKRREVQQTQPQQQVQQQQQPAQTENTNQQQQQQQQQPEPVAAGVTRNPNRGDNNIFGTDPQPQQRTTFTGRANATSANNPFSTQPVDNAQPRSSTRVTNAPGGGARSVNNIW